MIVYADSSVLVRGYLTDENGHTRARALIENPDVVVVTGSWTRIEVAGALSRAIEAGRGVDPAVLDLWESDTAPDGGLITILTAPQTTVEDRAYDIVVHDRLRAMDAWHVATASLTVPQLADGEPYGFATRDDAQSHVASRYGFTVY